MIRRATQIRIEQLAAPRRRAAVRWLKRYEHGIDPLQHTRVIYLQHPAAQCGIVHQKQPEILRLALIPLPVSPRLKAGSRTLVLLVLQIEGIEKQELLFRKVDAAKSALRFPGGVHVVDIHNME